VILSPLHQHDPGGHRVGWSLKNVMAVARESAMGVDLGTNAKGLPAHTGSAEMGRNIWWPWAVPPATSTDWAGWAISLATATALERRN